MIRANFADDGRKDALTEIIRQAALRIHANIALLNDQEVKFEVVVMGMDAFNGPFQVKLQAEEELAGKIKGESAEDDAQGGISDELLAAMK